MNTRLQGWVRLVGGWCVVITAGGGLGACSGDGAGSSRDGRDAGVDVLARDRQANQRQLSIEQLAKETAAGERDSGQTRDTLKQLIWKSSAPEDLRLRALELLLADTAPASMSDTRNLLRLRLPTEANWKLIGAICKATTERASDPEWRIMTASLVRSYARNVPVPTDDQRPERAALAALYPGQDTETTVMGVFVRPVESGAPTGLADGVEKSRQAAWELLSRLDPTGSRRQALLAEGEGGWSGGDAGLATLRRAARELGIVPVTGSELAWLERLGDSKDAANAAWWSSASGAVARLSAAQRAGLALRHLEPIRWASVHKSELLGLGRGELLSELTRRFDGRTHWRKTDGLSDGEQISRETLEERQGELSWGDALALIVVDEAIADAGVISELSKQVMADRADTSTEYGGGLFARDQTSGAASGFVARGFPSRPAQRVNDRTFVASEELFAQSARSLAHFHFHAQNDRNATYAGPGLADLAYARTHGRTCAVFTTVREGIANADYYVRTATGTVTIDMGEVRLSR